MVRTSSHREKKVRTSSHRERKGVDVRQTKVSESPYVQHSRAVTARVARANERWRRETLTNLSPGEEKNRMSQQAAAGRGAGRCGGRKPRYFPRGRGIDTATKAYKSSILGIKEHTFNTGQN